jgi:hypothetical protein
MSKRKQAKPMNTIPEGGPGAASAPTNEAETQKLTTNEAETQKLTTNEAETQKLTTNQGVVTPENTFGIAYAALKAALQQFVRLDVPAADPQRLKLENEFEAVRVAQEARTYPAPLLAAAGEALQGALTFLSNHTEADRQAVQHLTGQASVIAKRAGLFAAEK